MFDFELAQFQAFVGLVKGGASAEEASTMVGIADLRKLIRKFGESKNRAIAADDQNVVDDFSRRSAGTPMEKPREKRTERPEINYLVFPASQRKPTPSNAKPKEDVVPEIESEPEAVPAKEKSALQSFLEAMKKNPLEDLTDWVLTEAEYCSHVLLMANGKILVNSQGNSDEKFLWASRSHRGIGTARPKEDATRRLEMALETLNLILSCSSDYLRTSIGRRYRIVADVVSEMDSKTRQDFALLDVQTTAAASESIRVKPFYDLITDGKEKLDLLILKNGLPGYTESLERLLKIATGSHCTLNIINALQDANSMICDFDQVRGLIGNLAWVRSITDIRVVTTYVTLFRCAFGNLKFTEKTRIMRCFYEEHGAPSWQDLDADLEKDLTSAINGLCDQSKNKDYHQTLASRFCWFFMLAFKFTLWQLLQAALRIPAVIPVFAEMLRLLPPVTEYRPNADGPPLVVIGIRRLLDERQVVTEEHEINWTRLLVTLSVDEKWVLTGNKCRLQVSIVPVIQATECFGAIILPALGFHPRLGLTALLSLLSDGVNKNMKWWSEATPKYEDGGLRVTKALSTLLDVLVNSRNRQITKDPSVTKRCFDAVRILVMVWKDNGILLSTKEAEDLERRSRSLPWTIRCWILEQLRVLSKDPIRLSVPQCFFDVFQLPTDGFCPKTCEDRRWSETHSALACSLTGLFEIGSVSVAVAHDILVQSKLSTLLEEMNKDQLNEPVVDALMHALMQNDSVEEWRGCVEMFTVLFDRLKEESGAQLEESLCVKSYSIGQRMAAPVGKLCEAVVRMIATMPSLADGYAQRVCRIAKEVIIDRVGGLEDPLAKIVAWETLFVSCCYLTGALTNQSTEMVTLLLAILDNLKKEGIRYYTDLIEVTISCLDKPVKDMLVKKLRADKDDKYEY